MQPRGTRKVSRGWFVDRLSETNQLKQRMTEQWYAGYEKIKNRGRSSIQHHQFIRRQICGGGGGGLHVIRRLWLLAIPLVFSLYTFVIGKFSVVFTDDPAEAC